MGSAMKKKQAYLNEWKLKARRRIMPGFPIEEPFETREQVEAYLNVDRMLCLLCGRTFKSLCAHLLVDGTNADHYKQKYGLPLGCGLTCITTKAMNIKHGKRLVEEGIFRAPTPEEHAHMIATAQKPRSRPAYVIQECIKRISGKQPEKIFSDSDYWKILEIAEFKNCAPTKIYKEYKGEVPSASMMRKYARENPDYKKKYDEIVERLPTRVKMKHGKRGNDYPGQIKKLKNERKTNAEIAKILGVHENTIEKYSSKYGIKKPLPSKCKNGMHPYPGIRKRCQPCDTLYSRKRKGTMDRNISKVTLIDRPCSDCGKITKVIRIYGTKKIKYCEDCKKKRYYESQKKYAIEKRPNLRARQNDM
jgi:hypothetical protein